MRKASAPSFAGAVNCMDGRTQLTVYNYLKRRCGAAYVDMITEPGPVRILARGKERGLIASIRKRVGISVEKHGARLMAVVAHHDCAGNPAAKKRQLKQLAASVKTIRSWGFEAEVIGLWVDRNWKTHQAV